MVGGGYTEIGQGAGGGWNTEHMSTSLREVPGIICTIGCFLALIGQILQWTQSYDEWCPTGVPCSQALANQKGTYNLFLFIISMANLLSYASRKPQILYISTALTFAVLEQNMAMADEIRVNSMSHVLLASYILSFIGVFTTFVTAFPYTQVAFTSQRYIIRVVAALVIDVLLIVASIVLWSRDSPFQSSPFPVTIPAALAVWHLLCSFTVNIAGLELAFLLSTLFIVAYQPFGPTCHDECLASSVMIFICLWALVVFHLAFDCVWALTGARAEMMGNKKLWVTGTSAVIAFIGGVVLWASTDSATDAHLAAPEVWATITMVMVPFIMVVVHLFKHHTLAVVAATLMFSVIDSTTEQLMTHQGTALRVGYIFVFIGSMLSFIALPVEWSTDLASYGAKVTTDESRPYIVASFSIFCSIVYLWSEQHYYGSLGFLSLAVAVFVVTNFVHGLHWVYFIGLLIVPSLTPFTTPEQGVYKITMLIIWIAILSLIYIHLTRFGSEAFQGGIELFAAEGTVDPGERTSLFGGSKTETKPANDAVQVQTTQAPTYATAEPEENTQTA